MSKKNNIENFTSIMNYIREFDGIVSWYDITQFCLDYNMYKELYLNHFIFNHMIIEHNNDYQSGKWKKPV